MGLDIWFVEDIRNALLAANEANAATSAAVADTMVTEAADLLPRQQTRTCILRAYREGYAAALATIALAFGLSPTALWPPASDDLDKVES